MERVIFENLDRFTIRIEPSWFGIFSTFSNYLNLNMEQIYFGGHLLTSEWDDKVYWRNILFLFNVFIDVYLLLNLSRTIINYFIACTMQFLFSMNIFQRIWFYLLFNYKKVRYFSLGSIIMKVETSSTNYQQLCNPYFIKKEPKLTEIN